MFVCKPHKISCKTKRAKAYRKTRGKEMAVDRTFEFEKRRNRSVKYDRNLMGKLNVGVQRAHAVKE